MANTTGPQSQQEGNLLMSVNTVPTYEQAVEHLITALTDEQPMTDESGYRAYVEDEIRQYLDQALADLHPLSYAEWHADGRESDLFRARVVVQDTLKQLTNHELECPAFECPGIDVDGPAFADDRPTASPFKWAEDEGPFCRWCGAKGEPV